MRQADNEAGRHVASKTAITGTKYSRQEIFIEIGKPACKKSHAVPPSQGSLETKTHDPPAKKKKSQANGQLSVQADIHQPVAAKQKHHKCQKTTSGWSADSAPETEYVPQSFDRHPSNPYYIGADKDNNDPDLSLQARGDSFDDDNDPAFMPKQISIMKTDLNQTFDDLSGKLHRKNRSVAKLSSSTR